MRKPLLIAASAALVLGLAVAATSSARSTATPYKAALVSDVVGFNDAGFNKNQLIGLNQAAKKTGLTAIPLVSHSSSDYSPNFNTAVRNGANIIVAAGYLLGDTVVTYAKQFPNINFAITDDSMHGAPFADKKGKPLYKNISGITYAANESGCLVGVLAAKEAQKLGKKVIGAVGGIQIPPVDIWIAGYRYCANLAVPGTKTVVQYSGVFDQPDKCAAVAQNEIGQGAKIIFGVAGSCGTGALKAASAAGGYGIGVDVDQYKAAKNMLTSGTKHTDTGVYDTVVAASKGQFTGGTDLVFNLKNNGVGVGRINPVVPRSWIALMNSYKARIIAGKLKVPTALS